MEVGSLQGVGIERTAGTKNEARDLGEKGDGRLPEEDESECKYPLDARNSEYLFAERNKHHTTSSIHSFTIYRLLITPPSAPRRRKQEISKFPVYQKKSETSSEGTQPEY